MEKQDLKLMKVNDRIQILQLTRSRNKKDTEIRVEKDGFKPSSRLD